MQLIKIQIIVIFFATFLTSCYAKLIEKSNSSQIDKTTQNETTNNINHVAENTKFITLWKTDNSSNTTTNSQQIILPLDANGVYSFIVEWGDGTSSEISSWDDTDKLHTYTQAGTYTVKMYGHFSQLSMTDENGLFSTYNSDPKKLLDILQWGTNSWKKLDFMFAFTDIAQLSATDLPDFSTMTSMIGTFYYAQLFNGQINNWNVSAVTSFRRCFQGAQVFNQALNNWNTGSAIDLSLIFNEASAFNQNINSWNVSNVQTLLMAFEFASVFNQPLGQWDVSQVTDFREVFAFANAFNQNINTWNISNGQRFDNMFYFSSAYNQPLNSWNPVSALNMSTMFLFANQFNQDIQSWNVTTVTQCGSFSNNNSWTTKPNFTNCTP